MSGGLNLDRAEDRRGDEGVNAKCKMENGKCKVRNAKCKIDVCRGEGRHPKTVGQGGTPAVANILNLINGRSKPLPYGFKCSSICLP